MAEPYYADDAVTLLHGDALALLADIEDGSIDAVVTDPPYGLGFMGREWDDLPPGLPWAQECLRVLKPGGYLLAFGGARTWHRLAVAVEDAGFEVRDSIAWLYGSGFPKSLDVSKAIDKAAGATREVVGRKSDPRYASPAGISSGVPMGNLDARANGAELYEQAGNITAPATPAAQQWQGWGTALKPAFEPIVVGRKPLVGTVAANVLAHGTGALNIDGCRVQHSDDLSRYDRSATSGFKVGGVYGDGEPLLTPASSDGRWPTNVVLDGHAADELDRQSGVLTSGANPTRRGSDKFRDAYGDFQGQEECVAHRGADSGGASRFFPTFRYEAKAPTAERPSYVQDGSDGQVAGTPARTGRRCNVCGNQTVPKGGKPWPACGHEDWAPFITENRATNKVTHPTVKPLELMRWLVRLVTPPGGVVLDPFAGSGTTAEACVIEGFRCIAIEREAAYLPLITARLSKPIALDLFGGTA